MRILLIDVDTTRPDHLGCYGYHRNTSPNVDRIASEAVRFTQCFASDTPCLPSRTALYSGRLGVRTGVVGHAGTAAHMRYPGDGHVTDPARRPLPMVLSMAGTRTSTISTFGQRHLAWHFYAGWDEIQKFSNKGGNEIAAEVEVAALEWVERNARRESWFAHIHYWDPHTPYRTPPEYGNPFADDEPGPFPTDDVLAEQQERYGPLGARDITKIIPTRPGMPDALRTRADFKVWIDGYDTGIRYFDDSLGRVLDALAAQGVLDDTAIILTSDHGENQGELNLYGAHLTADAITTRIPLLVRWPGMRPAVRDEPVYLLDLAPTVCEMLGIDAPAGWDGRSLAPALRGEPLEPRPYLVVGQGAWFVQRGVIADGFQYLRTMHPALDPMPGELLFDMKADPHQLHNLVGDRPDVAARMGRTLTDWWHDTAAAGGRDPLLDIVREGGGYYVRTSREMYLRHLRDTGRDWAAKEIEERHIAPIVDPFDMARF